MLRITPNALARAIIQRNRVQLFGAPGAPILRLRRTGRVVYKFQSEDLLVESTHRRRNSDCRLLQYIGKHVPHPQKSLWSPDSPVAQDRHLFKLTTIDIDAFKYWFGVKRCRVQEGAWRLLSKAGLLPPTLRENSKLMPKPIFEKEALMKYYLANRKDLKGMERRDYLDYENGLEKSPEERAAERPVAPFL